MSESQSSNRRVFTRVPVGARACLLDKNGELLLEGTMNDVSLGGISVDAASATLAEGTLVQVSIGLMDDDASKILASGRIVRSDRNGTAVALEEISDPESYAHLRNLVLYNAPETDEVEDEIERHAGISRKEKDA